MKASRPLYNQFTPEQRVQLVFAATARGDTVEVARLRYSCPREKVGEFRELLDRMERVALGVLLMWLNRSHRLVQARLVVTFWPYCVAVDEVVLRVAPPADKRKLKIVLREDRALLVSCEAQYKQWSAEWKGIEAAITRFCAERSLTPQQLFADGLPPAIDEARAQLDADVPAARQMEDEVYQILCHLVAGPNAGGRG